LRKARIERSRNAAWAMLGRRKKPDYRRALNFLSQRDYTVASQGLQTESSPGDSETHYNFL